MLDEVKNLIYKAQEGDEKATEELVERNLGLIRSAVRRFYSRGVCEEDLFQLGAMGLVKAIKRFDLKYEVEFSTYAVPMIIGEIRRFLRDDGMIKVSRSAREKAAIIRRIRAEEGDGEIEEIAKKMGISYEDAIFALEATVPPESTDREIFDSGGSKTRLGDLIPSKENEEDTVLKIELKRAIESLPERDKKIIMLRYYREMTQSQVAKIMNIGQVQVSRLEKKIIEHLRKEIG
ncbi:MAG: sigma-70 family RNA polymerase sigma factor [Clostridia bacterium]|nr:sigma-70 family RNA polymerase sigma factor [Clostridia bacterium]